MADPLVLLPPSEGKAPGGRGPARTPGAFPALEAARGQLGEALAALDAAALARALGGGAAGLSAARAANAATDRAPTLPALERFTGVVFSALDVCSLRPAVRAQAGSRVLIVDGRWGLLRGDDPVPEYKLAITASLPGLGPLARWWRGPVSAALAAAVAGQLVWDLLPVVHRTAWAGPGTATVLRVKLERPGGGPAGHLGKRTKGLLARHLLEHPGAAAPELERIAAREGLRAVIEQA